MEFKRGNTYTLQVQINDINVNDISKIVFKFNNVQKEWERNKPETDVVLQQDGTFIVKLSQKETLTLYNEVNYEVAVKFTDNSVKRSKVKNTPSLETIIREEI